MSRKDCDIFKIKLIIGVKNVMIARFAVGNIFISCLGLY